MYKQCVLFVILVRIIQAQRNEYTTRVQRPKNTLLKLQDYMMRYDSVCGMVLCFICDSQLN